MVANNNKGAEMNTTSYNPADYEQWHREAQAYRAHGDHGNASRCVEVADSLLPELAITVVRDRRNPRSRTRLVDPDATARSVMIRAFVAGRPIVHTEHGGTVANAYKHPAPTQGVVCVGFPDGRAVLWLGQLKANGVTLGGVLSCLVGDAYRAVEDGRYGPERQGEAKAALIKHADEVSK